MKTRGSYGRRSTSTWLRSRPTMQGHKAEMIEITCKPETQRQKRTSSLLKKPKTGPTPRSRCARQAQRTGDRHRGQRQPLDANSNPERQALSRSPAYVWPL